MTTIRLTLPAYAINLMREKTCQEAYDGMLENNGLPFQEMVTFGWVITPIVTNESGAETHHVVYWFNGQVSVTEYTPGNEFLKLIGVETWGVEFPTKDEALEIFYRHVKVTE